MVFDGEELKKSLSFNEEFSRRHVFSPKAPLSVRIMVSVAEVCFVEKTGSNF